MATSTIQKMGKEAFLVKAYSGTYTLEANAALGILGNSVGYTAPPTGYTPVAFQFVTTNNNDTAMRFMQANGYGGSTLVVVRNFGTNAISNASLDVRILFVRSDLIGT